MYCWSLAWRILSISLLACEISAIMNKVWAKFEHSLALSFFGIGMKTDLFQSCGHSYLPEFAQIHVHWVSDAIHLIFFWPLFLLPSVFPSIMVFFSESALHVRCSKYWNFSFSISPSNEYSGLISFRTDRFDLLSVQRTLKSLLQHQFFSAWPSFWTKSHILTWLLEKYSFDCRHWLNNTILSFH